jgi:hypothetical protein
LNFRISRKLNAPQSARLVESTSAELAAAARYAPSNYEIGREFPRWISRVLLASAAADDAMFQAALLRGETPAPLGRERLDAAAYKAIVVFLSPASEWAKRFTFIVERLIPSAQHHMPQVYAYHSREFQNDMSRLAGDTGPSRRPLSSARRDSIKNLAEIERLEALNAAVPEFAAAWRSSVTEAVAEALGKLGHKRVAKGLRDLTAGQPVIRLEQDLVYATTLQQVEEARQQVKKLATLAEDTETDLGEQVNTLRSTILEPLEKRLEDRKVLVIARETEKIGMATEEQIAREQLTVEAAAKGDLPALFRIEAAMIARPDLFPDGAVSAIRTAVAKGFVSAGIGPFFEALAEALG